MKLDLIHTVEIDISKEKERIDHLFSGEMKAALLKCINLFEKGDFKGAIKAYKEIPYSNEDECPGQEYMPMWFTDCLNFNPWVHDVTNSYDIKIV